MPFIVMAADITGVISKINDIIGTIIPVIISLAVLLFIWGVVKYITAGGDPEKREEARSVIIYGIIGLFVIVSVWGLVALLSNTFNLDQGDINIPQIPHTP